MNAPEDSARPGLTTRPRRGWRDFFLQEWGLLLLAAALAWIIYDNARDKVLVGHAIDGVGFDLRVEDQLADRVAAVITGNETSRLRIRCSKREKEDVVEPELRERGFKVAMVVFAPPQGESQELGPALARYDWKFSPERLEPVLDPTPRGRVFRIDHRQVEVSLPETLPSAAALSADKGVQADVTLSSVAVNLLLPVETPKGDPLVPDPIDLGALLSAGELRHDVPLPPIELTFSAWRSAAATDWERAYRQRLVIPPVQATVVLRKTGEMSIQNALIVLLDAQQYQYEFQAIEVSGVSSFGRLSFTGKLRGRLDHLQELAADAAAGHAHWVWAMRVTEPSKLPPKPEAGAEPATATVNAEIVFMASQRFRDLGIVFLPEATQDAINLKVRWHADHK